MCFSGSLFAISAVLFVHADDYLPDVDSNFLDEGVAVQVDYGGRFQFGSWIMAQPGTHTYIGLQQKRMGLRNNRTDDALFAPPCKEHLDMKIIPSEGS